MARWLKRHETLASYWETEQAKEASRRLNRKLDFNSFRPLTQHPGPPPSRDSSHWKRWYAAYQLSDAWRDRRRKVLERANHLCEACRERRATEVHHLHYMRVGYEPLFDLVAICRECHETLHRRRP
jgi:5-methylcytosine-specific restriction endonuclease McrA